MKEDSGGDEPEDSDPEPEDSDPDSQAGYHPPGFEDPTVHSVQAKKNEENCTDCHGEQLEGGTDAPSCDSCHPDGWRTNCVFCHGGEDNASGAPPRDLSGAVDASSLVFRAHTAHVEGTLHDGFGCEHCHVVPETVMSPGHLFDSTPIVAEVVFGEGLASLGNYEGSGSCSNIYCHSNAVGGGGDYEHTGAALGCGDCHPGPDSTIPELLQMTSQHAYHMDVAALSCDRCHGDIVNGQNQIVGLDLHVNGNVDVTISELVYDGFSCNGSCHSGNGEAHVHTNYTWGPPPGQP
ncbi:MAG: CxxxxCH/CxxCH domain-containing protein [Myxococcota bacterium]|nr:CxxxxCH/CxxCH domain-containing protein [Myxococcota bacterium]